MFNQAVLEQGEIGNLSDARIEAEPEPFPDPAGTATFDAATSTLSVPALPAHATSLRAFRSPGAPGHPGTGRHLDHDHRIRPRRRPAHPRRDLRILARRPQLPRRRAGE